METLSAIQIENIFLFQGIQSFHLEQKRFFIKSFLSESLGYGAFALYVAASYLLRLDNLTKV